ncbi:hypothetical protein, partial [Levilactobacillus koreensis]|uniref:hypothetical protein n=1 Tax=Levilactobacillus koreensis TaxID=637971 RepID=UPI001F345B3B
MGTIIFNKPSTEFRSLRTDIGERLIFYEKMTNSSDDSWISFLSFIPDYSSTRFLTKIGRPESR